MADKLAVVLVLQYRMVPRWLLKVILKLRDSGEVTFPAVFLFPDHDYHPSHSMVYRLHELLDQTVFRNGSDDDRPEDLIAILDNPVVYEYTNNDSLQPENFMKEDWDVLLNLSNVETPHWLEHSFCYGVLGFSIDPPFTMTGMDPCYRALVRREPYLTVTATWSGIFCAGKKVIHRSYLPVDRNSMIINERNAWGMCEIMIPRLISGLYRSGIGFIWEQMEKFRDEKVRSGVMNHAPLKLSGYRAFRNMAGVMTDFVRRKVFYRPQFRWFLMVDMKGHAGGSGQLDGYKPLYPPDGCFWADPFPVSEGGSNFIFAEEFDYRLDKGRISVIELDDLGNVIGINCIIDRPYHMSYPFVFKVGDTYYMIPETSANRTIELYECTNFPMEWKFVKHLAENLDAVDTTLFYHDHEWWMFTAVCTMPEFPDYRELFLYHAHDFLAEEWHSHPSNPVVSDIRNARPAGGVFIRDGKLYRPAQDCSGRYGRAINFNEISEIDTLRYSEKKAVRIKPPLNRGLKGIHTFNSCSELEVIDVYEYCKRFGS